MKDGSKLFWPCLWGLISCIFSTVATLRGPAIPTGDSMSYMNCGRALTESGEYSFPYYALVEGGGLVLERLEPNTVWPPLTSLILAGCLHIGFTLPVALTLVIVVFAGTSVYLSWIWAYTVTKSVRGANVVAAFITCNWAIHYWVQKSFMAEGVFLTVSLATSLLLVKLVEREQSFSFARCAVAGLCLSPAYYIKSAGPAFLLAGAILPLATNGAWAARFMRSVTIGGFAGLGALPWLIRNLSYNTIGSAGAGPLPNAIVVSVGELLRVFVPYHGPYAESRWTLALAAAFVGFIALWCVCVAAGRSQHNLQRWRLESLRSPALAFSVIYPVAFIAVILFAMYVLPIASHIEMRYWMEIVPFFLPAVWVGVRTAMSYCHSHWLVVSRVVVVLLLILIFGANVREIVRNRARDWSFVPRDQQRIRSELALALHGSKFPVRFLSNRNVKFEALTGITAWKMEIVLEAEKASYCFVEFSPAVNGTMSFDTQTIRPPTGWLRIGTIADMTLYRAQ